MFENKVMERPFPENLYYEITEKETAPEDYYPTLMYLLYGLPDKKVDLILERYRDGLPYRAIGAKHGFSGAYVEKAIGRCIESMKRNSILLSSGIENAVKGVMCDTNSFYAPTTPEKDIPCGLDSITIAELSLSARSFNALTRAGYVTVADIVRAGNSIEKIRSLGEKSLTEIFRKLDGIGVDVKRYFYRAIVNNRLTI